MDKQMLQDNTFDLQQSCRNNDYDADYSYYDEFECEEMECFYEERDFYSSEEIDDRLYQSGVEDIEGGDNFADYAKYFFNTYGEDLFD